MHPYYSVYLTHSLFSPTLCLNLFSMSASPLLLCEQVYQYHPSRFHIYMHQYTVLVFLVLTFFFFFLILFLIYLFIFTILYWFCHTLTWIHHGCTRVPHPEPPSRLPLYPIPLGHPSTPDPRILFHALNLDWWFVSHMVTYMFQCHSPKSSHPRPLPQTPKDCYIHLCLFCCLAYRVIITIFLNSIYMH